MKKEYKIFLSTEDYNRLLAKAHEAGYSGKGGLSHFLSKLANEIIIFGDANLKQFLAMTNKPVNSHKQ